MDDITIHALYSPLWEKIPQLQPHFLMWHEDFEGFTLRDGQCEWPTAAALCRVAVEDWLMQHRPCTIKFGQTGERTFRVQGNGAGVGGGMGGINGHGATIHHALVDAAMAINTKATA